MSFALSSFAPFYSDLNPFIDAKHAQFLNADMPLEITLRKDNDTDVHSVEDEQLIAYIPFTQSVKMHEIRIRAPQDGTQPSRVLIFLNKKNMSFNDVGYTTPTQAFTLSPEHWKNGVCTMLLKPVLFHNVQFLTIFVDDNVGHSDSTTITSMQFLGSTVGDMNVKALKKCVT